MCFIYSERQLCFFSSCPKPRRPPSFLWLHLSVLFLKPAPSKCFRARVSVAVTMQRMKPTYSLAPARRPGVSTAVRLQSQTDLKSFPRVSCLRVTASVYCLFAGNKRRQETAENSDCAQTADGAARREASGSGSARARVQFAPRVKKKK